MSVRRHSPPDQEVDLEATAELPVIDFAAPADDETQVLTDSFAVPAFPAGVSELAESLREVESRLQRKTERLKQLESQLAALEARERDQKAEQERERNAVRQREADAVRQISETEAALTALRADFAARETTLLTTQQQLDSERQMLTAARREVEVRATAFQHQAADLADARARSERQLEALQNSQGLQGVREALIGDREAELHGIETRHAAALSALTAQLEAIKSDSATQLAAFKSDSDAQLAAIKNDSAAQLAALKSESAAKFAAMQADSAAKLAVMEADLATAEASARSSGSALEAQRSVLDASVQKNVELATQLEARDHQISKQDVELSALRATAEQARQGVAVHEEQKQRIEELQAQLAEARQQSERFEQDLRVAEEQIQRLESDAHASAAMLGNLQMNIARLGREDTGTRPTLKVVGADLPARFLIRQEGGVEVQHPLSRRTTIGRTPDNDIQIDTTFVSRHHAVILSSSQHCVVEDLNSTNGVMVNGRRVNRHILHEGDEVIVGNTVFRFQQPA